MPAPRLPLLPEKVMPLRVSTPPVCAMPRVFPEKTAPSVPPMRVIVPAEMVSGPSLNVVPFISTVF